MQKLPLSQLEKLESDYLETLFHYLSGSQENILKGFNSKEKIRSDWYSEFHRNDQKSRISDFARGAERIVYSILNGRDIGEPNSAPVGSDLFFELPDKFVHIDLKTVQTSNIGDYTKNIFVGDNQNSYKGEIKVHGGSIVRPYSGTLPSYYKLTDSLKPCLTYFIAILYDSDSLETLCISVISMPNGDLGHLYPDALNAGKNPGKIRLSYRGIVDFKLLENRKRIKIIYFNDTFFQRNKELKKKLAFLHNLYLNR
jgi:hypothetical protein